MSDELKRLDEATDACLTHVSQTFKEIASLAEKRSLALSNAVKEARDKKKQVLEEQLKLIASEKAKVGIKILARLPQQKPPGRQAKCILSLVVFCVRQVDGECDGLQYQVEVRNITQKISSLTEKLDSVAMLSEPRENSFLTCDFQGGQDSAVEVIKKALENYGKVRWCFLTDTYECFARVNDTRDTLQNYVLGWIREFQEGGSNLN